MDVVRRVAALSALLLAFSAARAHAENFTPVPARTIGPYTSAQTGGSWTAADDRTIGAALTGQDGWTSAASCAPAQIDDEVSHAVAHGGNHSLRISNWFTSPCVDSVVSPAFAAVGAPGAKATGTNNPAVTNTATYSFWFRSASTTPDPGLSFTTQFSALASYRLTYLAFLDSAGNQDGQCVNTPSGFHLKTIGIAADDGTLTGNVQFTHHCSPTLTRGAWYRAVVTATFDANPLNDVIDTQVFDSSSAQVWQDTSNSWQFGYYTGFFNGHTTSPRPVQGPFAAEHVTFDISASTGPGPAGKYASASATGTQGIHFDDMSVTPGSGASYSTSFNGDRWVASNGSNAANDCSTQSSPCQTIAYAISQANPYDTIHIASGTYDLQSGPALTVTKEGLELIGEGPTKPQIKRTAGGANQALLVINGAKNVQVQNLEFDMDQTFVAEGIIANGFVDGLSIDGNHFINSRSISSQNSDWHKRIAISINDDNGNSQGIGLDTGSNVSVTDNAIDGATDIANGVFMRMGVDMDNGVGTIGGNTITAGVHDIRVRFSTVTGSSSGTATLIDGNTLNGRGLEFDDPNGGVGAITISNNHIFAPAGIDDTHNYDADFSLMRLIGNPSLLPVGVNGNTFSGFRGSYRGVLVENFPHTTFTGNTFTPASGASDFVSLVVSNKAINSDGPPPDAPLAMSLSADGNIFDGSSVANAGRAVELLNDNNAGGAAIFGNLTFGALGANVFDGNLRWYFHLDDYNCDTVATPCPSPPLPNYAGAIGPNPATNTEVRPFSGHVDAGNNTFAGVLPADMSTTQQGDLEGHTYDVTANAALGTVAYGFGAFQTVYVDSGYSGNYGDAVSFTSPAADCGANMSQTAYFGVNAFASISDGVAHVQAGGYVCIAANNYADNVTITQPMHIVGAGQALTTLVPAVFDPLTTTYSGAVIRVRASDVEVSGLTVDGINPNLAGHASDIAARAGIMTDITGGPYANFSVHNTTVKNIYLRGIYAPDSPAGQGVSNFSFRDNTVSNVQSDPASIGIFSRYGTGIVDGNTVDGANDAISANWSKGVTFRNNTVTDAASGIHSDNNGGGGGVADLIENNTVDCNVVDSYGVWVFANYADTTVRNNKVTRCAIGIGSFGGRTSGSPPNTVSFIGNVVSGTDATTSAGDTAGAYLSTTTFYYGDHPNNVILAGNTISGFGQGIFTERTGSPAVALTTTASFNRIVGNVAGWDDGAGPGTSTFVNNWWGCNGGPGAAGCDSSSNATAVMPWLILQAGASPNPTGTGTSTITANLTHNSANAVVGTAFPDGTSVAFSATRGSIAASANTAAGTASTNLDGLTSGWSTVHVTLDNADVQLIVSATPAATFATVNDDTTGTNPDPDATCPTPDFNTITAAINALPAGSKILVCSGNYPENVVVDKPITLRGAFAGTAGNDGARGTNESVLTQAVRGTGVPLTLKAANVTIDGMAIKQVTGPEMALLASGPAPTRDAIKFLNNRLDDYISDRSSGGGFQVGTSSNLEIAGNWFGNFANGAGGGKYAMGIRLDSSAGAHVHDNTFWNVQSVDIQVTQSTGAVIEKNAIDAVAAPGTGNAGIQVANNDNVVVRNNTIAHVDSGLLVTPNNTTSVSLYCNTVSSSTRGLYVMGAPWSGTHTIGPIFDNRIEATTLVQTNWSVGELTVGSNYYGGATATSAVASIADPLPASPIGAAACGDNTATQIVAYQGSPQSTPINTAFANPLVARVQDALGGAVLAPQTVTFAAPASGALAVLGTTSGSTNYNGTVSTGATANGIAGSYLVNAASGAFTTATGFALTNGKGTGTVVWDATSFVYTGSNVTPTAHIAEESGATCSFTPPSVGPNVGSYNVTATCESTNYTASGSTMVSITPATATLSLSHLTQAYDGAPKSVLVATSPANVGYSVSYVGSGSTSYGPSTQPPVQVGTYTATASVTDPNYIGSNVSDTLQIVAGNGDISLVVNGPVDPIHVGDKAVFAATMLANPALHQGETYAYEVVLSKSNGSPLALSDIATMEVFYQGNWVDVTTLTGGTLPFTQVGNDLVYTFPEGIPGYTNGFPIIDASWTWNVRFSFTTTGTYTGSWTLEDGTTHATINPLVTGSAAVVVQPALPPTDIHLVIGGPAENQQANTPVEYSSTMLADPMLHTGEKYFVRVLVAKAGGTHALTAADLAAVEIYYQGSWQALPAGSFQPDGNGNLLYIFPQAQEPNGFEIQDPEWTWNFRITYADTGVYTATAEVIHASDVAQASPQVFASDAISTTVIPQVIVPPTMNLVLVGPVNDVAVGAPAEYTGTLLANPADFSGRTFWVRVRLSRNGGADAMTTADLSKLELFQGGTWVDATTQIKPVMVTDGNDLVYYFPQPFASAFSIDSPQWTWHFRFTYANAALYAADADVIDSTDLPLLGATLLANAALSTNVVAMPPEVSLDLQGPVSGTHTGVATAFTARIQNVGGAVPENAVVKFQISRNGGSATTGDLALEYFDGSIYQPLPLAACAGDATKLCGTFGPGSGFPVSAGYDATTPLRATFATTDTYTVQADVVGVPSNSVLASDSLTTQVSVTTAQVAIDLGSLHTVYDGNPHAATVTTMPAGLAVQVTYNGSTTPPINAGSYSVVATITESGYSGSASDVLVIDPAPVAVTLSNLTQTFDGTAKAVTVTTNPAGVATSVTYDGSATVPSAVGSYTVVATVTDSNYTGSASATLFIVAASAPNIAVSITDNRDYVQYGKLLTYKISVSNIGNTDITGASISVPLPATVLPAQPGWSCLPLGLATCGSGGNGALNDTANIPVGGGVVYLLNVWANDSQSLATDGIVMQASVTAAGDIDTSDNTATDLTTMVIFRDGFEEGGDGAQVAGFIANAASVGSIDGARTQGFDISAAWSSGGQLMQVARIAAGNDDVLVVQAIHIGGQLLVRLAGNAGGKPMVGAWSRVPIGTNTLAVSLGYASGHSMLILVGASEDLTVRLSDSATNMSVIGIPPGTSQGK